MRIARDGRLWCIDQGLTFHQENKLRTVIWDFQGQPVPLHLVEEVCRFGERLAGDQDLRASLLEQIAPVELAKLEERVTVIDHERVFPPPPPWRPGWRPRIAGGE